MGQACGISLPTRLEDIYLRPYYALEKLVAAGSIPKIEDSSSRRSFDDPDVVANEGGRFDHSKWDKVLRVHVDDEGRVDYRGMADDASFEAYLAELAAADVESLAPLQQLALHLNAYNALCASLVVRREPATSILDLSTKDMPVWDAPAGVLGGETVSLNDVEHRLLRFRWDEPSIHACIVCASKSREPASSLPCGCDVASSQVSLAGKLRLRWRRLAAARDERQARGLLGKRPQRTQYRGRQ